MPSLEKRPRVPSWQWGVLGGILISGLYYNTFYSVIGPSIKEKAEKIAAEAREKRLGKKDE